MLGKFHNLGISLSDYAVDQVGAGTSSQAEVELLMKALEAGSITGGASLDSSSASGAPLKVESLENTLKVITFQQKDIALWKRIPNLPAYNTVEEYNQLTSYGSEAGGFTMEGELPEEDDSTYVRRAELVKFMGTTRVVTHPMQLVATSIPNVLQQEIQNGTIHLLKKTDRALVYADSDFIPQEFNGLFKQQMKGGFGDSFKTMMESESVIDMRGAALTETKVENGALVGLENHGSMDLLVGPPKILSNFASQFHESKRIIMGEGAQNGGMAGQSVAGFISQFGPIEFSYDKFMRKGLPKTMSSPATHSTKAPTAPVADTTTPKALASKADTQFLTADLGDYYYAVSASNRYGESALTDLSAAAALGAKISVTAGNAVNLKFTAGAGGVAATGFTIYRTTKNPAGAIADAVFYPLFTVSAAQLADGGFDGSAAGYVLDKNRILANTDEAFLIENDIQVYSFKQLAPLMKMDLAVLSPATRFMLLLYGTPMLYAPKKFVRFINVGTVLK